jgi:hypothetical protein
MKGRPLIAAILGLLISTSCSKKAQDSNNTTPTDPTPSPVIITDQADGGKDTTGKWEIVHHRDVNQLAAWTQLIFPTSDTGYLVNTAWLPTSAFAITLDGGKTWSAEHFLITNNEFLNMIDGKNGIGYRKSSGTTYGSDINQFIYTPTAINYYRLVYDASGIYNLQTSGISIPSREFVYITLTNGQSLRLQNPFNYSKYIFGKGGDVPSKTTDLFFINNITGWLCTSDGQIMITKDSSKTWSRQLSMTGTGFSKIYFANANLGWAASYNNSFYKTTDGGSSWTKVTVPGITSSNIQFVFISATRGFFIAGREVYETSNGGDNWTRSGKMGKETFQSITKQGNTVYILSMGSERRTTPLSGGGTQTSDWTYATILKYQ